MSHWIEGVVRRAGLEGADLLTCPVGAGVGDAWGLASRGCGVESAELARVVARDYHLPVADFTLAEPSATKLIPESLARRYCVFPLKDRDRYLEVAIADPVDVQAEQEIGFASGRSTRLMVAPPDQILDAIDAAYSPDQAAERLLSTLETTMGELEILSEEASPQLAAEDVGSGPVVRLTNIVFQAAIEQRASDIHIQPTAAGGVVRYRVDGVLRTAMQMPMNILVRVISRIKVIGRMDIADRIRPQDGRARVLVSGVEYDLRISTVPARGAEKVVVRILDPQGSETLDDIGMAPEEVVKIRRLLARRDGIFVVTGPTGSGKTSTLYAALREISTDDVNIMTVEDPVEYVLSGLTQIQVEPKQGVTFASALRAILRQDPDVVFIGEIRDEETAGIAAQASLTGHLVLATLHTNDAVGAIRRFLDLGLQIPTLTETFRGALAQRLLRRVCPRCSTPAVAPYDEEEQSLMDRFGVAPVTRVVGCEDCQGQGYRGRVPVTELLTMTPALSRMIADEAQAGDLEQQARRDGMKPLLESALELVAAGVTTLQEVARVVGEDDEAAAETDAPADRGAPAGQAGQSAPDVSVGAGAGGSHPAPGPGDGSDKGLRDGAGDGFGDASGDGSGDGSPAGSGAHVLLVDDDAANRNIAKALLLKEGYQVTEATDGDEALARVFQGTDFDLVVLDLDMPNLGGEHVLHTLRRSAKTLALPVVILTGSSEPERELELMEEGADDYIRKPLEPRRFMLRVKATLRRARA